MTQIPTPIDRRAMLGKAAAAFATVVVSQGLVACGADAAAATSVLSDTTSTVVPGTGATNNSCVLTAALTEGPYFVDEKLLRSDIRTDVNTGVVSAGTLLTLAFNVARVANSACTPLTGAYVDVWHADAAGNYSDVSGGGSGRKFLRGYQITDANGQVNFTSIYPGWYSGRAVHIHFKVRLFAGATKTYEFTSQFFMDEALNGVVHAASPYNTRGTRNTLNTADGIYNSLSAAQKSALTLQTTKTSSGYAGVINLDVALSS